MKDYLNFWVIKYLNGYSLLIFLKGKSNIISFAVLFLKVQKFTYVNTCNRFQNLFYSVV